MNKAIIVIIGVVIIVGAVVVYSQYAGRSTGYYKNSLITANNSTKEEVKEFSMDSFVIMEGNQPRPQFSVKDITVKKGDKVKIMVNVTGGQHNFNLDEFNIHSATPTGQTTAIEFTADQVGDFVYYCSIPGHRANGHWGTIRITE